MIASENNVALLVHSCDRYELLYKGFEFFFSKHWSSAIDCNLYFATEQKNISITGFQNIKSGKGEWANRLRVLLTEKIPEKYVLYMQEDMWLNKKINPDFFNQLFALVKEKDLQQVKLHSSGVYSTIGTGSFIEGFSVAIIDNEVSEFLMSHQVTIWNKNFLLQQLYHHEHPWRNERKGTKRLKKLNAVIYHVDYFAENGQGEINDNHLPVLRSEYQTISVNGILNNNVLPYIDELMRQGGQLKEYAIKLQHNFTHQLTHDGKAKPRKIDIFKKMKNWFRGQ